MRRRTIEYTTDTIKKYQKKLSKNNFPNGILWQESKNNSMATNIRLLGIIFLIHFSLRSDDHWQFPRVFLMTSS